MSLKKNDFMDLSLDDYIAISKKSTNNAVGKNNDKIMINGDKKDAKFGRRKGNIDDEDEDEEDDFLKKIPQEELEENAHNKNDATDIWKGPDPSISYLDCYDQRNDLREKLNNSSNKNSAQKYSSVQYRIMAPNNVANRPRGLPTLLPLDVQMKNRNWTQNRSIRHKWGNQRNLGSNYFERGTNNIRNNYSKTGFGGIGVQRGSNNLRNNYNYTKTDIGGVGVNDGRLQRTQKQDNTCKNLRFSVVRNDNNKSDFNDYVNVHAAARNMIIETPSASINLLPSSPIKSSFQMAQPISSDHLLSNDSQSLPIGKLTTQAEAVLNLNSVAVQNNSLSAGSNNGSLKSLLGFQGNISSEMMPEFASRLMDYIQNGLQNPIVHKPVYDMKLQKDIHEIQKKPLLYKCPGGEVVSSDGAGVNCKIIPRTSGMSLNCRFA